MNGTPIIDPMLFYWMNVSSNIIILMWVVFICLVFVWAFSCLIAEEIYHNTTSIDGKDKIARKKFWDSLILFTKITLPITLSVLTFMPSQDTMYKMIIANTATVENFQTAKEQGKEIVEFFKQQAIDVVEASKK